MRVWPLFASVVAVGVGTVVLIGWQFDLDSFKRVMPRFVAMNPSTATFFIFCGIALALLVLRRRSAGAIIVARILAAAVALGAACEAGELIGLWHSRVDELLFASKLAQLDGGMPNRMAPNTTLGFVLAGVGLLATSYRQT